MSEVTSITKFYDSVSGGEYTKEETKDGILKSVFGSGVRNGYVISVDDEKELKLMIRFLYSASEANTNIYSTAYCKTKNIDVKKYSFKKCSISKSSFSIDFNIWEKIVSTIGDISTHACKFPNSSASGSFFINNLKKDDIGIHSATLVGDYKELIFSGNAAKAPYKYLFSYEFIYQGKITSILSLLFNELKNTKKIIVESLSLDGESLDILNSKLDSLAPINLNVSANNNGLTTRFTQVLFPNNEGDYTSITPIPSVKILKAMHSNKIRFNNLKEGEVKKYRVDFIEVKAGGANPQNSGDYFSSITGKQPCFLAEVPYFKAQEYDIIGALSYKKTVLRRMSRDSVSYIKNINKVSGADFIKGGTKDAFVEKITDIGCEITMDLYEIESAYYKNKNMLFGQLNNVEKNFIIENTSSSKRDIRGHVFSIIIGQLYQNKIILNNETKELINKALKLIL
jgi:hypothetical protein